MFATLAVIRACRGLDVPLLRQAQGLLRLLMLIHAQLVTSLATRAKSARPGESPRVGALCSAKRARLSVSDASLQPTPLDSRISLEVSNLTRGLRVSAPTPTAAWTSTRSGVSGDASMVSQNTTCSSSSRSMRSTLQDTVVFLLRSDHEGRTWVSVAQSLRRFSQRRHHRDRRAAPRTLDAGERDFEADAAAPRTLDAGARDFEADAATPRTLDAGARNFEADVVAPRTVDSGARDFEAAAVASRTLDAGARDFVADAVAPRTLDSGTRDFEADAISISSDSTLGTTEVKAEPFLDPTVPPTLLCKEEVSATSPVSRSCDPAPDVPGFLDGFPFLFAETDNFVARSSLVMMNYHLSRTRSRTQSLTLSRTHWKACTLTRC